MQTSITFTGTADEIATVLEAINGGGAVTAKATPKAKKAKRHTAASLADMSFADLKALAESLDVDPKGKKSAGLRKAILDAQDSPDEEEEEDESDEDDDEDWEDDDEDEDEDDEDEDEEEDEDDEDEDEEEEEEPAPKRRGRPAKAAAKTTKATKKAPARRRR